MRQILRIQLASCLEKPSRTGVLGNSYQHRRTNTDVFNKHRRPAARRKGNLDSHPALAPNSTVLAHGNAMKKNFEERVAREPSKISNKLSEGSVNAPPSAGYAEPTDSTLKNDKSDYHYNIDENRRLKHRHRHGSEDSINYLLHSKNLHHRQMYSGHRHRHGSQRRNRNELRTWSAHVLQTTETPKLENISLGQYALNSV